MEKWKVEKSKVLKENNKSQSKCISPRPLSIGSKTSKCKSTQASESNMLNIKNYSNSKPDASRDAFGLPRYVAKYRFEAQKVRGSNKVGK